MHRSILILTLALCLGVISSLVAQQDTSGQIRTSFVGDTTNVYYYTLEQPNQLQLIDSALYDFEEVQSGWNKTTPFVNLGTLGSPRFKTWFTTENTEDFRIGIDQYQVSQLKEHQIRYYHIYDTARPFSDLYYSQINQQNNLLRADFGSAMTPGLYMGIQYQMLNELGFYDHQRMRNQNIGFNLRVTPPNTRYRSYFHFTTHTVKHENNGGVLVDSVQGTTNDFLDNISVLSNTALMRTARSNLSYQQNWFSAKNDSLGHNKSTWSIGHRIRYTSQQYKFFDKSPTSDYYGPAYVNPRGNTLIYTPPSTGKSAFRATCLWWHT